MLVFVALDKLLLAPQIEAVVAVQRDDAWGRELDVLGDQDLSWRSQVGRGLKGQVLFDVVALVCTSNELRLRLNGRRRIREQLEDFCPRASLPLLQAFEFRAKERERQWRLVGLSLYERIEVADVRASGYWRLRVCNILREAFGQRFAACEKPSTDSQVFTEFSPRNCHLTPSITVWRGR